MSVFELEALRATINGRWLQKPGPAASSPASATSQVNGVGIDTREDLTGRAFFAIRGAVHDGHSFLHDAVRAGAALLVVERAPEMSELPTNVGVLQVSDTRRALAKLALAHRRALRATKVIAITGSAGKTTTKRLIYAVLSRAGRTTAAPKSFNNDIGVPLTILSAKSGDKFLILEIGSNAPGEIATLAAIAEPDIAVITSIGRSHLAGFGSIEAVAKEKASLLGRLEPDGVAIVNADAPLLRPLLKQAKTRILFGEANDADLRLTGRGAGSRCHDSPAQAAHLSAEIPFAGESCQREDIPQVKGARRPHDSPANQSSADSSLTPASRGTGCTANVAWWFEVNNRAWFEIAIPGRHNALNALAAVAVGRRVGLDDETIAAGLATVQPEAMRQERLTIGPWTIWNDAYNANPDSMIAAIETFVEVAADAPRRIVVLGDMLELGDAAIELHREVGRKLIEIDRRAPIAHAMFIGELSRHAAAEVELSESKTSVTMLPVADDSAGKKLAKLLKPGDAVLIKGSRSMGLERLPEIAGSARDLGAQADGNAAEGCKAARLDSSCMTCQLMAQ